MSAAKGVLDDLVRRRLWPVALLLIVAAIAAPIVLAAEPEVVAPVAPAGSAQTAEGQPIASLIDDFSADERRRVLGAAKDPFRPSGRQPKPAQATPTPSGPGTGAPSPMGGTGPTGLGNAGSGTAGGDVTGGGAPSTGKVPGAGPAPGGTPAPAPEPTSSPEATVPKYALHSLRIRFDDELRVLKRLEPLPDAEVPAIIYLGLLKDEKTAVFLLDEKVSTEGDGTCHPSPEDCQRVHLTKGETQFFDVAPEEGAEGEGESVQHQLDLVSITASKTKSAKKARKAYGSSSPAGRRALRSRIARAGRLQYDARTGLLRRASVREHRAALARAAVAATVGR